MLNDDELETNDIKKNKNHLGITCTDFKIAVEVPALGLERMLESNMLFGKLNDLIDRGLIPHADALEAFQKEQKS